MSGKRKHVSGIVTKGCSDSEYFKIRRARTTEDQIKVARELGVLDEDHYRRVMNAILSGGRRHAN